MIIKFQEIPLKNVIFKSILNPNKDHVKLSVSFNSPSLKRSSLNSTNTNSSTMFNNSSSSIFSDDNTKSAFRAFANVTSKRALTNASAMSTSSSSSLIKSPTQFLSDSKCDQLPCSVSMIDLLILCFRLKHSCEQLVEIVIPDAVANENLKLFQYKLSFFNSFYQVNINSSH